MDLYGRSTARNGPQQAEWSPAAGPEPGLEESMRRLGLWNRDFLYPERLGVPNCAFYMRTGACGYGVKCRYNHPRDRSLVGEAVRIGEGEFPERPGEPACQYYLRTGTCKFGASCKFHHPRDVGVSNINVQPNSLGYPLRPGENECSYYLKTGQCKFGMTCKFHHPQPSGMSMPSPARPFYPTVQSSSIPSNGQYGGSLTGYRTGRPPLLPGSYPPGAYGPMMFPPGVVPIQGWSTYSGPVSPVLSPSAQPTVGVGSVYGVAQLSSSAPAFAGPYQSFTSSGGPSSSGQKEKVFPERLGEPACQYYLKTGDCKFGSSCRYHHPPDWVISKTNCVLSPLGLPLRPGVQPCAFYLRNGYCKFGPTCKFDHPIRTVRYSPSASSLTDVPVAPYMVGSSLTTLAPSFSYASLDPHSSRMPSSGNTLSSSAGLIFSHTASAPFSNVQLSGQSSSPLSLSMSTRQGDEVRRSS
ncbi:hypothetical protein Vadar_007234 [Vaccinium darrowii]|uniref:Uncharacterized protein n=1 Tax=Vaccinium darrowii TaxID=229202 RepID=A0ACB7X8I7_9ERIC|nr:hypothetical protein Vadar_007234 [Vaccinium darrowii]